MHIHFFFWGTDFRSVFVIQTTEGRKNLGYIHVNASMYVLEILRR